MPTSPSSKTKAKSKVEPNGDPNWEGIAELCAKYPYSRHTLLPVLCQGDNKTLFRKAMCASPDTKAYKELLTIFIKEATQLTWLIQGTDQFRQIWESFPNHRLPLADTMLKRSNLNTFNLEQEDINSMKAEIETSVLMEAKIETSVLMEAKIKTSVDLIFKQPKRQIPDKLQQKIASYLCSPSQWLH